MSSSAGCLGFLRWRKKTASTVLTESFRIFTLAEIKDATERFHDSRFMGSNRFGKFYKGIMENEIQVFIHRAHYKRQYGIYQLVDEIYMLWNLCHRNLIPLMGFCEEEEELILVYEYMANGNLAELLYNNHESPTLGWRQRLEICTGVARGLHYLHTGAGETIIHGDLSTKNILLDKDWVAKLGGVVLATAEPVLGQYSEDEWSVLHSPGYLDPEFLFLNQWTVRSDVYSFGVVLLEVLCGRPALDMNLTEEKASLVRWAHDIYVTGQVEDMVDSALKGEIATSCLLTFAEIAYKCTALDGDDRPTMEEVLRALQIAQQEQECPSYANSLPSL